jgi:hypothetical protein
MGCDEMYKSLELWNMECICVARHVTNTVSMKVIWSKCGFKACTNWRNARLHLFCCGAFMVLKISDVFLYQTKNMGPDPAN